MPRLIDTHCHLQFAPYNSNRDAVVARMRETGTWAVTVGTSAGTSKSAIALAVKYDGIWASVGYHPEHLTSDYRDESEGEFEKYDAHEIARLAASSEKIVAIGETGLDFYRLDEGEDAAAGKALQEKVFAEHINLALKLDMSLIIHCRNAFTRLAEMLQEQYADRKIRGVVHCFTGSWEEAKPLLDLGLHLSFTGIITFPPKKSDDPDTHVHRVIERMPLERIMVETDAPWLAPVPFRGKQNEPSFVRYVAEKVAELRGVSAEEAMKATTENAQKFFRIF